MKELVEVIAKALVDQPDEVSVTEKKEGRTIVLELHVADGDMGKVIGKQGRIAKQSVLLLRQQQQRKTRSRCRYCLRTVSGRKKKVTESLLGKAGRKKGTAFIKKRLPLSFTRATSQSPCLHETLATAAIT